MGPNDKDKNDNSGRHFEESIEGLFDGPNDGEGESQDQQEETDQVELEEEQPDK